MSFRERTAWITAISIMVCFGVYYGATLTGIVTPRGMGTFHLGLACILALVIMQVGFNIFATLTNPKDARTPRDEREKMIQARSHTVGYYVLMFGIAGVLFSTHIPIHDSFGGLVMNTVNLGLFVMVAAALSVAIAQIIMFRRGY